MADRAWCSYIPGLEQRGDYPRWQGRREEGTEKRNIRTDRKFIVYFTYNHKHSRTFIQCDSK